MNSPSLQVIFKMADLPQRTVGARVLRLVSRERPIFSV